MMGDVSLFAWLLFVGLLTLASAAGVALAMTLPWNDAARKAGLPIVMGILVAPFLTGLFAVLALITMPQANPVVHLAFVAALLFCMASGAYWAGRRSGGLVGALARDLSGSPMSWRDYPWLILLVFWIGNLLVNSTLLPLHQNDSLEYAMVGREIYFARSLSVYPLLDSEASLSGFFAPWTHPPMYVSLIYLMYAIQGHAVDPGLMRLVAPWFLIAAAGSVVLLGRLHSWRLGLIASVFLMSAPLLFLGVSSALLDGLPLAGLVMVMVVVLGIKLDSRMYPVALGVVLGLSLWTHSQAILLVGLAAVAVFARSGVRPFMSNVVLIAVAVLIALVVAGAPYIKNYRIFGSLISDTPLIFALSTLDWPGYFAFNRGLDNLYAILQYGVLKGWFSLEAYGFIFWAWLAGLLFFVWLTRVRGLTLMVRQGFESQHLAAIDRCGAMSPVICLSFVLVLTYLAGVVMSVLIGVDLMIRNERYMLMVLPAVALGAAYALDCALNWLYGSFRVRSLRWLRGAFVVGLGLVLLAQWLAVGILYRWSAPNAIHLSNWPNIQVVDAINRIVPEGQRVLAMRPADMYYAERPMVSYLDERLVPFYEQKDPAKALQVLRNIGIRYVQLPDYFLPPVYNSTLPQILSDPSVSRLVFSSDADQLYELVEDGEKFVSGPVTDFVHQPWYQIFQVRLGGRKVLETFGLAGRDLEQPVSQLTMPWFHRDYGALLLPGGARSFDEQAGPVTMTPVMPGQYRLEIRASGRGYVQVWMRRFNHQAEPFTSPTKHGAGAIRLFDFSLTDRKPEIVLSRLINIEEPVAYLRFGLEQLGMSRIEIESMTLTRLEPSSSKASDQERQLRTTSTK